MPAVRSTRCTIDGRAAGAPQQVGQHLVGEHRVHLVRDAGQRVRDPAEPVTSNRMPGAVPRSLGSGLAPSGRSACR